MEETKTTEQNSNSERVAGYKDFGREIKMAGSDYYSCDKCGCKTFYDANLSYTLINNKWKNPNPRGEWNAMPDGNVGDMMVLCKDCAKKYKVVMRAKKSK